MIHYDPVDLPHAQDEDFRKWLNRPEMNTLKAVAAGTAKKHLAMVANQAVEAKDFAGKLDAASVDLKMAQKWKSFLECLDEITAQKQPFATAKLT
jgi:hypothetical protein